MEISFVSKCYYYEGECENVLFGAIYKFSKKFVCQCSSLPFTVMYWILNKVKVGKLLYFKVEL